MMLTANKFSQGPNHRASKCRVPSATHKTLESNNGGQSVESVSRSGINSPAKSSLARKSSLASRITRTGLSIRSIFRPSRSKIGDGSESMDWSSDDTGAHDHPVQRPPNGLATGNHASRGITDLVQSLSAANFRQSVPSSGPVIPMPSHPTSFEHTQQRGLSQHYHQVPNHQSTASTGGQYSHHEHERMSMQQALMMKNNGNRMAAMKHAQTNFVAGTPASTHSHDPSTPIPQNAVSITTTSLAPAPSPAVESNPNLSMAQKLLATYNLHPAFLDRYDIGDELGSGGFGFVVTAQDRQSNREVAVKFVFKDKVPVHALCKDKEFGVIPMEVYVLKNLRHPNIIAFVDFFEDSKFYYLVMELHGVPWTKKAEAKPKKNAAPLHLAPPVMQRSYSAPISKPPVIGRRQSMDLFECIEANQRLSEDSARKIFRQVVSAVQYLAAHNVIHRDIKDENIVVDQDFTVKIIDFGSASMVPPNGRLFDRFAGTLQYCPPEVLQGAKYRGPEQEIWALGILLYTILFSGAPFANMAQVINHEVHIPRYTRGANQGMPRASKEAVHLLQCMLQKKPECRATIGQVSVHPWLVGAAPKQERPAEPPRPASVCMMAPQHRLEPQRQSSPLNPNQSSAQIGVPRLPASPAKMSAPRLPRRASHNSSPQHQNVAGSSLARECSQSAKPHPLHQEVLADSPNDSPIPSPVVGRPAACHKESNQQQHGMDIDAYREVSID